jgi:hypothetical protein
LLRQAKTGALRRNLVPVTEFRHRISAGWRLR